MLFGHNRSRLSHILLVGLAWSVQFASSGLAAAAEKTVRVFILAGQSNMEGAGQVRINPSKDNGGQGSLEYLVKSPKTVRQFAHCVDKDGEWIVRDDVWIWYLDRKGGLSVGYGARKKTIGPEFQFGHVMGQHFQEPVLIIKTAWGGKSLVKDFRPPSAGGEVGPFYQKMITHVREVLAGQDDLFPALKDHQAVLSGFGWHQGWNDGCSKPDCLQYETNLAHFIRDVRKALNSPGLPFVIAGSGFGGWEQKIDRRLMIMKAQEAIAKHDEFKGDTRYVETRSFFRDGPVSPPPQVAV